MILQSEIEIVTNKAGLPVYRKADKSQITKWLENQHQQSLNLYMEHNRPDEWVDMFHVVNESGKGGCKKYGEILKRRGRKSGVSDWFYLVPLHGYHGAITELKVDNHRAQLSAEQKKFLVRRQELGFAVAVCHGYEAAIRFHMDYINNKL